MIYETYTTNKIMLPHGGYKKLLSYQMAEKAFLQKVCIALGERTYRLYSYYGIHTT